MKNTNINDYKLDLSFGSTDRKILKDLKNLFIYICVTRFSCYYKSYDNYKQQISALNNTKSTYKKLHGKTSPEYQKNQAIRRDRFNACFTVPNDILKDIRGYYRDENKKLHLRPLQPFINYLISHHFLSNVTNKGCKHNAAFKNENEKTTSRHWTNKYFLNEKLWHKLLKNDKLKDLTTFQTSTKLKKLIGIYYKKLSKEELENAMTKQEKIDWQAKYDRGETCMTVEEKEKLDALRKRKNDKRKMTIAKKAAKETIADYAKLQTEIEQLNAKIEQLQAENEQLKQLKDLNSDIEEANAKSMIQQTQTPKQVQLVQQTSIIDNSDIEEAEAEKEINNKFEIEKEKINQIYRAHFNDLNNLLQKRVSINELGVITAQKILNSYKQQFNLTKPKETYVDTNKSAKNKKMFENAYAQILMSYKSEIADLKQKFRQ